MLFFASHQNMPPFSHGGRQLALAMATSARSGVVLQDSVAELEMGRAVGGQTEDAFVPSSYEAKELY